MTERSRDTNFDISPLSLPASGILESHFIPQSNLEALKVAQLAAYHTFHADSGKYAELTIYPGSQGLYFLRKRLGATKQYPIEIMEQLSSDYRKYTEELNNIGIRYLALNYNLQVTKEGENGYIQVDQLLFPYGTALDWCIRNQQVEQVTEAITQNHLLPILDYRTSRRKATNNSPVYMDASLANFAILPTDGNDVVPYYLDFFVPRIRHSNGKIKRYRSHRLHTIDEDLVEYRFFTKPGIIHNFIRKTYLDIFQGSPVTDERQEAWNNFSRTVYKELHRYLIEYFPNKTVQELAETNFDDLKAQFIGTQ